MGQARRSGRGTPPLPVSLLDDAPPGGSSGWRPCRLAEDLWAGHVAEPKANSCSAGTAESSASAADQQADGFVHALLLEGEELSSNPLLQSGCAGQGLQAGKGSAGSHLAGATSVRGRRVRPPQVGVRQGPGASISEAAWWSSQRARPVTTEGSSMSPSPCVPAGRFRRSGTRAFAEAGERLFCGPWSRDNPGHRSDGGASASGARASRRAEPPAQPALALTREPPDAPE
jgi:hypothetical protein